MKRIFLTFALALFAVAASAQQGTPKKPSVAGFVTNGFWDNMEISVGAGAGTALSNGTNHGSFGDRIDFEANFSITKWIHPVFGFRVQLQGGRFDNYDAFDTKYQYPYLFVHTDFMLNFSNWAGGYRDDRAYYLQPFFGFGYMATNFTDKSQQDNNFDTHQTIAFTAGLLNKFRLSPSFDFNIELKGLIAPSRVSPANFDGAYMFGFSATAGFTYRFNKRYWQRGAAGYTIEDIHAIEDALAATVTALEASQAETAQLGTALEVAVADAAAARAEAQRARQTVVQIERDVTAEEDQAFEQSIILFDYSMSTLTPQEQTRLELIAERIKKGSSDKVYKIQGHADQQTGSREGNRRVAQHRAKRVYDFLVSKGVNARQLTYEGYGNEPDQFRIQKANRNAIIK